MFNPYEWHTATQRGKTFQWRVKAGMAEQRQAHCDRLQAINDRMEQVTTFRLVDEWHATKAAILGCEERS